MKLLKVKIGNVLNLAEGRCWTKGKKFKRMIKIDCWEALIVHTTVKRSFGEISPKGLPFLCCKDDLQGCSSTELNGSFGEAMDHWSRKKISASGQRTKRSETNTPSLKEVFRSQEVSNWKGQGPKQRHHRLVKGYWFEVTLSIHVGHAGPNLLSQSLVSQNPSNSEIDDKSMDCFDRSDIAHRNASCWCTLSKIFLEATTFKTST